MATNLYLRVLEPTLWAASPRHSMKDAGRGVTPGSELYEGSAILSLSTSIGTGAGSARTRTSVTGATSGIFVGSATTPEAYISPPLSADFTISGTVSFDLCGLEAAMAANATFRVAVYRVDHDGALTLIINSTLGTELGTSLARHSWSGSPTSTDCKIGDRILVLPMFDDATAVTMASGHTLTLQVNGANASTADSRVVFTEDLTFITSDPTGTVYYLRDTASDVSGAKALSTTQGSGTAEAVHTTIAGPITYPGDQWTATAGGADIEWFGPTVNAFTLSGAVLVEVTNNATALETSGSPFDSLTCELAWCDSDGSNPVVWARSYTSGESTASPKKHYLTGPSTSIAQGKRPRLRFYSDDMRPSGNQASGTDRTIRYDGTSTYASRLIFTQTITEGAAADPLATKPVITMTPAVHRAAHW